MTAPRGRRGGGGGSAASGAGAAMEGSSLRGALLIAVAAVVGVVLLGKGLEGGLLPTTSDTPSEQAGDEGVGTEGTTPATDGTGDPVTTEASTPTTHAPAQVKVQILNGGGPQGAAGTSADALIALNFVASAENTDPDVPATVVYFAPGYDADAVAVAQALGITAVPTALPAELPSGATPDTNVVVILGPDFTPPA